MLTAVSRLNIRYGDYSPKTSGGRAFFIVWGLLGVGTLTILFSVVSDAWANRVQQRKLAGEKVKKKSRWSKLGDRVRGNKGRKQMIKRVQKEEEEKKEGEEAASPPSENAVDDGVDGEQASTGIDGSSGGGGILLDTSGKEKEAASSEKEVQEPELSASEINQLHIEFTTTAMDFHKSALEFVQHSRGNVAESFRDIPEVAMVARKVAEGGGGSRYKITPQDRNKLLDAVQKSEDAHSLQSVQQWLLIQDFEYTLHSLVDKSSTLQEEVTRMENELALVRAKQNADEIEDEVTCMPVE
jgi:hypothetical protein